MPITDDTLKTLAAKTPKERAVFIKKVARQIRKRNGRVSLRQVAREIEQQIEEYEARESGENHPGDV